MEFPDLGRQCSSSTCNRLDFLPMKCDSCNMIFCMDHFQYSSHQCANAYKHDVQVPVCPLCNQPVPTKRGEAPDIRVGEHIDRDCQSDPAMAKRKVYTSKCNQKGCKQKEMIKISCSQCGRNYCLKHRFPLDHNCQGSGVQGNVRNLSQSGSAALTRIQGSGGKPNITSSSSRVNNTSTARNTNIPFSRPMETVNSIQGNLSEDEALALALQKSLSEPNRHVPVNSLTQEEADRQLALALAESERQQGVPATNSRQRSASSCSVS